MRIIKHAILLSIAVFVASYFIDGINIDPIWVSLIVGAVLTIINLVIKPIIKILTLPINIITLGLFSVALNVAIFWYLGHDFINGFSVDTWKAAFWGSVIISVVYWLGNRIFGSNDD